MKRTAVDVGDERIRVDGLALLDRNDDVHKTGPRALGVEHGGAGRVIWMAVVVADDVEPGLISLAIARR